MTRDRSVASARVMCHRRIPVIRAIVKNDRPIA
jgi:hypothetical protein